MTEDTTLVFFCHLGVMFTIMGHLLGMSPVQLWHNFYVAPTSVTILNTEERLENQAMFRVERLRISVLSRRTIQEFSRA